MNRLIASVTFGVATALLIACGGAATNTATNTNSSRSNSSAGNTASTVANSVANAANSVANSVSKATTDDPNDFMTAAAQGGMTEVEASKIAVKKSQNAEVKKFAQAMIADHTKAGDELKALATKKNVALPADLGSHKSTIDDLNAATAPDFDKDYVDAMVSDHESTVSAFEKQANNAADADVKAFAAKTLPTLKKHLEMIKAIQAKMK